MKVILECKVDPSIWGDDEDLNMLTDEQLAALFSEGLHDLIRDITWTFVRENETSSRTS